MLTDKHSDQRSDQHFVRFVRTLFSVIYSLFSDVLIEFDAAAGECSFEITPIRTEFV
jgi:hypothetical protein